MGKTIKSIGKNVGRALGFGDAGNIGNTTKMNLNFGKQMADRGAGTQFVQQQQQLANQLMAQAQGQGPSLAQAQLQQATDQNIAQQMAMAASTRGGNLAMAQRQAAMNAGQAQQQMAGQSAIARLQEQNQAQALLGQTLNQGQTGIDNFRANMTQLANQRDIAQTAAAQKGGEMFGNFIGKLGEGLGFGASQGKGAAGAAGAGGAGGSAGGAAGAAGGAGGAGGLLALFSDERVKKNVKPAGKKIEGFLDALKAHEYEYKGAAKDSELGGKGKHVSPMAQEIEKTELGKGMVKDTSGGKVVDYGKGFGVMLAAMAEMHDRMKKLEGKKKNG